MTNIIIDPYILAYPNNDNEFENYIDKIIELNDFKDKTNLNFLISSNTSNVLVVENNFPYWDTLNEAISKCGLTGIIQPQDIISTLEGILKYAYIENVLKIDEILYNDILIIPDDIKDGRLESYVEELNRLLMYICIAHDEGYDNLLLTTELVDNMVSITGELVEVESEKKNIGDLPKIYKKNIATFHTLDKLYSLLDPIQIWKTAASEFEYDNAIYIYIYQRTGKYLEEKTWIYGRKFLESMKSKGFLHEEAKIKILLKSLANTILCENLRATHALRQGQGGNTSQVTRSSDKAWRRDIDYEYHLHYWELENGFEFASLVVHNDMSIPV
ncbi:hypothetical protein ACEWPB_15620 [Priestia megaterium]|uniref:hypothetical protein n=1 Tax=Priestia megaterium TaxID=1404 RepID=UPI0035CA765D